MFVPAPIDKNFVPYGNRRVLRRNASLIIDAGGKGGDTGGGASRVVPQQIDWCHGLKEGAPCGPLFNGRQLGRCVDHTCDLRPG
jgi:hypothetical protein